MQHNPSVWLCWGRNVLYVWFLYGFDVKKTSVLKLDKLHKLNDIYIYIYIYINILNIYIYIVTYIYNVYMFNTPGGQILQR